MFWENPHVLELLWILPLVGWVLLHAHRKRVAAARTFAEPAMVRRLMPSLGGTRPWAKALLLLAGLASLIVAGARPRFGVYTETVSQRGVDLFVVLDVSRSMTAEDVAPNRLERAKSDIRDLLPHLVGDRVGLIVFAGKPVVKLPLTNDQGFFRSVLDEVDIHSAPRGGTLIGDAIRKALETMPRSRDRDQVLVLITDGEDQESYAEEAAKQAAERGVKIFTVGLGDAREGARIPVRDDAGRLSFLQDEGRERWSKLDEDLLKKIALTTGGAYIPAGTRAYDLGQVYADHLAGLTRSEYAAEKRKRYREQFQWFVCLGVLLLLAEMGVANYKSGQQPAIAERPPSGPAHQGGEIISAELVSVLLVAAALMAFPSVASAGTREAAQKVQAGMAAYQAGDYKQAAAAFQEADVALPDDLRIAFDRGMALAAQGDTDKAVEWLQKAALSPSLDLAVRARYNLGCLAAAKARKRLGEHPETADDDARKDGLADLAVAVGHFRDCLQLDKEHADARHNLELIRVWLKYMQSLWEQHDRQQQREEMDLAAYLQKLEESQRTLRTAVRGLAAADDASAIRPQQREAETAQRKLAEEIAPLKEKITATLSKAAQPAAGNQQPAAGGQQSADSMQQAIAQLQSMADEAGKAIDTAAERLHAGKLAEAVSAQTEVVEKFNAMYRGVAPYPTLVSRAVETQQGLVDHNLPLPLGEGRGEGLSAGKNPPPSSPKGRGEGSSATVKNLPASSPKGQGAGTLANTAIAPSPPTPLPQAGEGSRVSPPSRSAGVPADQHSLDLPEAAWNQDFVTRYSELLEPLAKEGLKNLDAAPATPPPTAPGGSNVSPEELKKQREGLKQSMERAVTLGPKAEKLSGEAAQLLHDRKPAEALPKQEQALKLLKEIAAPLPKQKQQQNQQKQDKNKSDQKKQDQKKQPKPEQKPEQKNEKQKDEKQKQQEASQQQAEAAIQQVQQRQDRRKELEKQLQKYLPRSANVEKDW